MEHPPPIEEQWTESVTEYDVIATRGVGQNKNKGNLLFRDLVAERKSKYEMNANPEFRRKLGEEIVELIKPGRFLKKEDITQKVYKIMDHHSAVTKAMFAIRDLKSSSSVYNTNPSTNAALWAQNHAQLHYFQSIHNFMPPPQKRKYRRRETTVLPAQDNIAADEEGSASPNKNSSKKHFSFTGIEITDSTDSSNSDLESKASSSNHASPNKKPPKARYIPSSKRRQLVPTLQCKPVTISVPEDEESDVRIPFRSYGYPIGVYVSKLIPVVNTPADSTEESQQPSTVQLNDTDKDALDKLIQLKNLKGDSF